MTEREQLELPPRVALLIRDFAGRLLEADGLLADALAQLGPDPDGEEREPYALIVRIEAWRAGFRDDQPGREPVGEPIREEDPKE